MKLDLLRRLCGPTKAQRADRAVADAEMIASALARARLKAKAAIDEFERRRRTDTAIHDMRQAMAHASAMVSGVGGLTAQEVALLSDAERDALLRACAKNGSGGAA